MEGEIRSSFAMTEPAVASSDATNIRTEIRRDGDHYVINGRKWWASGAMDRRCEIAIVMGLTNPEAEPHKRQSMVLVPLATPGVNVVRALNIFVYDDAPHGHAEVIFENVRVPVTNILLGEGRGFEIAQGRPGPGRIHHCMRLMGVAEGALETLCQRALSRHAFGRNIADHGVIRQWIAESRMEIDQARLLTLRAAHMMDTVGNKGARAEIAMIKVVAPNMAQKIIDRAIQVCGGAGVSQDFHLAYAWARTRVLRKQPPGKLLPSAHAVDREFRVLSALAKTDVPVPRPVLFCDDREVIGTPFYLMERLKGRIFWSPALPGLAREVRRPIYLGMNDALARLHLVDWRAVGLAEFGRSGNYYMRQINRWTQQWQNSKTREKPSIDRLSEWLLQHIPPGDETTICHGDFRLDNMIFHPNEPRVIGSLDWELSTLGHPLPDLPYNCIPYNISPHHYTRLLRSTPHALHIPA